MGDRPILLGGSKLRSEDLRTGMIQRTPVNSISYVTESVGPSPIGEWDTHFVHHHRESVDVCLFRAVCSVQAKLVREEEFRGKPTDRKRVTLRGRDANIYFGLWEEGCQSEICEDRRVVATNKDAGLQLESVSNV